MLHALLRLVGTAFAPPARPPARKTNVHRRDKRVRLSLEVLESRTLLAGYIVNALGDAGAGLGNTGDLRYCLNLAMNPQNAGSTISIQLPAKGATIQLTNKLPDISQSVSIVDPSDAVVAGNGNAANPYRIFTISNQNAIVIISDLTIEFGYDTSGNGGGAILNNGNLTYGGGSIEDSYTTASGGGIYNGSTGKLALDGANVVYNTAKSTGGGISNVGGSVYISGGTVGGNVASNGGGGINNNGGTTTCVNNTLINGNADAAFGGGILNTGNGTFRMTDGSISANTETGNTGGGLYNANGGKVFLTGVEVSNNSANLFGGGMYLATGSTTNLDIVSVSGNKVTNQAGKGPGIYQQNGANLALNKVVDNDDPGGIPVKGP